jgi:molybdopterin-containing oxidoreductase family iron-sulfur binding subunit
MTDQKKTGDRCDESQDAADHARRHFLKRLGMVGVTGAAAAAGVSRATSKPAWGGASFMDTMGDFFQDHYVRMSDEEMQDALERIQRKAKRKFGVDISCEDTKPIPDTYFGYALNLSKCRGYRDCVSACVKENNQGRDSQVQYIRVLELDQGDRNLEHADHYYDPETVPTEGKWYMPVQCQQCDNAPCVKACPVEATWMDDDGIVVIDYNWCIGCRMCMAACPYWARHFNWTEPQIAAEDINPNTNYIGNRPRMKGVVEKCHFCTQRTRKGRQPACMEACPTGARVFGNLLDPNSDIRYILENKKVFRLKEELGTEPKFWYFTDEGRARS